ncbi:MAG: DUF6510 family protein [Pseudolabrys sp.]|jgi:hypothetical protein
MDRQREVPLDGNAAGGRLRELFALDMTAAEIICDGCGAVAEIGAVRVFGGAMGAILRCAHCDTVVLRLTHTPAGLWLDMRGTRRLFVASPAS